LDVDRIADGVDDDDNRRADKYDGVDEYEYEFDDQFHELDDQFHELDDQFHELDDEFYDDNAARHDHVDASFEELDDDDNVAGPSRKVLAQCVAPCVHGGRVERGVARHDDHVAVVA